MNVRLRAGVRIRKDSFGGICYVSHRDDFFAANTDVFAALKTLSNEWRLVDKTWRATFVALARLGICETENPFTLEEAYSNPSFLGIFPEIPTVSEPMVLNCFCTAHCPLKCVYCHADDLMQEFREQETDEDLENVVATANTIPAMVAVITGGDPLTRPDRAKYLIERLAQQKALVLDTSGVGDIDVLLPVLKQYSVHVRVSLDTISDANDTLRPRNPKYVGDKNASRAGAEQTIMKCLALGIPVTVQTVISSKNENPSEWAQLRDWLLSRKVRNWVLHVAVKGGSARRLENAAKKQSRPRAILPSPEVYARLWALVEDTQRQKLPIDIRCTDTHNTPNSVLLVNSIGDLYTEGYAHDGKVLLYKAEDARPDLVRKLWPHIDRFGHATRYLNWNPWFFDGESIERICYPVPIPPTESRQTNTPVETEAKYVVKDATILETLLRRAGFSSCGNTWQRDEYYDTVDLALASLDFVVRVRIDDSAIWASLKGSRFYTKQGDYSRIELEFEARSEASIRQQLNARGLQTTWFFEKRRTEYRSDKSAVVVVIDEIPEAGYYIELEGPLIQIHALEKALASGLGNKESRNYKEVFLDYKQRQGYDTSEIHGASFSETSIVLTS